MVFLNRNIAKFVTKIVVTLIKINYIVITIKI